MAKKIQNEKKQDKVTMKEYLDAQMELEKLQKEHGIEKKEKGISRFISSMFERKEKRQKVQVNRKKFLLTTVLLGWCGGHQFMAHRYVLGTFYLLLFWTGFPLAMTLIDLLIYIPIPQDENGNILV